MAIDSDAHTLGPPPPAVARRRRFGFVDFAAAAQPGFRNHVVRLEDVPQCVARYGADECYASIFCFSDDVLLYLAEHRIDGRPSIAGYDGKVWAPFLPLDFDAPASADLEAVLELTRQTFRLLRERWLAPASAVHVYFSGAKGFHLLIDTRVFGRVSAARDLPRVFSQLRLEVLRALPGSARRCFDLTIGDKVRLLRLPNTRHRGSRLFKVKLHPEEVLTAGIADIRALAVSPRALWGVRAAGLLPTAPVDPVPALVAQFARARRAVRRARGPHPYRLAAPVGTPETSLCAARRAMWEGPVTPGNRNNVAIRLASAFRLAGYSREDGAALLARWNQRQRVALPDRELQAVVHSAYARPFPYMYGCHDEVIRAVCPYAHALHDCADYRELHPRSGRAG